MATKKELEARRKFIEQEIIAGEAKYEALGNYNPAKQEGDTRKQIALVFVAGYFGLFTIILIGTPIYNALVVENPNQVDLENTLQIFGTLIGTSLGFVVGYYFKSQNN